ncbi:MAG: hypothetical protein SCL54_10260 [Bacillota bacterium]|nr:hypothetical protein [Bacillota bacterium]
MMALIITLIAFFGVVIINVFTYIGVDLGSVFPVLYVSFIVIFIMTSILFFKEARRSGRFRNRINLSAAYSALSKLERWLISAGGVYVAICFFINMFYMSDGGTGIYEGKYAILDKGSFQRFITEEMYHKYQLIEIRMITATFMLMGLIAIVGYYHMNFVNNDERRE